MAAAWNRKESLKLLIDNGADCDIRNSYNETARDVAIRYRNHSCISYLDTAGMYILYQHWYVYHCTWVLIFLGFVSLGCYMMIFYLKLTKLPFCLTLKTSRTREFLLDWTIALCQVGPAPAIIGARSFLLPNYRTLYRVCWLLCLIIYIVCLTFPMLMLTVRRCIEKYNDVR